jgi:hypothetical protein
MMFGRDALCRTLASTLVLNGLFLIGHRMERRGMAENPAKAMSPNRNTNDKV